MEQQISGLYIASVSRAPQASYQNPRLSLCCVLFRLGKLKDPSRFKGRPALGAGTQLSPRATAEFRQCRAFKN